MSMKKRKTEIEGAVFKKRPSNNTMSRLLKISSNADSVSISSSSPGSFSRHLDRSNNKNRVMITGDKKTNDLERHPPIFEEVMEEEEEWNFQDATKDKRRSKKMSTVKVKLDKLEPSEKSE